MALLKILWTKAAIFYKIMIVKRKTKSFISYDIVFKKPSQLQILIKKEHIIIMNITSNTNRLHWELFKVMIQNDYGNEILGIHIQFEYENKDMITVFLANLQR